MKAIVHLHKDRSKPGVLKIEDVPTPCEFRCLGESDFTAAAMHQNPARDPIKAFGDIPTGLFKAVRTVAAMNNSANLRSYGPYPRFVLNPMDGQALEALHNGRFGLLLHGGETGSPMPSGSLRPTHGCIRADDSTMEYIVKNCPTSFFLTVVEDLP